MKTIIHNILFILAILSAASVNSFTQKYFASEGSLPHTKYMHLAPGSDLADGGVGLGIQYAGQAHDPDYHETDLSSIIEMGAPGEEVVCYPNPVNDIGYIKFTAERAGRCQVHLFDITGRQIRTLADNNIDPGENIIRFNFSDIREGLYMYRLSLDNTQLYVGRLIRLSSSR